MLFKLHHNKAIKTGHTASSGLLVRLMTLLPFYYRLHRLHWNAVYTIETGKTESPRSKQLTLRRQSASVSVVTPRLNITIETAIKVTQCYQYHSETLECSVICLNRVIMAQYHQSPPIQILLVTIWPLA